MIFKKKKDLGDTHQLEVEAGSPIVPCPRLITKGDTGDDVWAMQDALQHWSIQKRPRGEAGNPPLCSYGSL